MLCRFAARFLFLLGVCSPSALPSDARGEPASAEALLPESTVGMVDVPDPARLEQHWSGTGLEGAANLGGMSTFISAVREHLSTQHGNGVGGVGFSWQKLRGAASGSISWAVVLPSPNETVRVVILQCGDRAAEARRLADEVAASERRAGAAATTRNVAGIAIAGFQRAGGAVTVTILTSESLVLCDHWGVAEGIARRLAGDSAGNLASTEAFTRAMARLAAEQPFEPDARIYEVPLGLSSAREPVKNGKRVEGKQVRALRKNRFDELRGVAGWFTLGGEQHDVRYRLAFYAPKPYQGMLSAMALSDTEDHALPEWVPDWVNSLVSLNLDLTQGFDHIGPLFDDLAGDGEEGTFQDVIEGIRDPKDGPGVDLKQELVAHLGRPTRFFSDTFEPIGPKSSRMVIAIPVDDPQQVTDVLKRLMEGDPDAAPRNVRGTVVWEVTPSERDRKRGVPTSALTVIHGQFMIATNAGLLERLMRPGNQPLSATARYETVGREIEQLAPKSAAIRVFVNSELDYRLTYELLRTNRLHDGESIYANLLKPMLTVGAGKNRRQAVDGRSLPDYDQVRPFLHPSGMLGRMTEDGWIWEGCILSRAADAR